MFELPNGWRIGEPVNLGPIVNSPWSDSNPSVTADGLTLVFGSNRGDQPGEGGTFGLWMSTRASISEPWGKPVSLGSPVHEAVSRYGASLSADGQLLLFSSNRPGGQGGEDLWQSARTAVDGLWGEPVNLGPVVNSRLGEVSPSLSDDGLTLVFASDRPDGAGSSRIWMSTRLTIHDPWSEPVNLGPVVNSGESDGGPDLSANQLAIVYESRRAGGHGVGDLWMCTRSSVDGPWSEPVNLGPHVNTPNWDAGPVLAINDTALFFSTRGLEGHGQSDLWMAPVKRPEPQSNRKQAEPECPDLFPDAPKKRIKPIASLRCPP
jgi:Tol biopolymer transport system component